MRARGPENLLRGLVNPRACLIGHEKFGHWSRLLQAAAQSAWPAKSPTCIISQTTSWAIELSGPNQTRRPSAERLPRWAVCPGPFMQKIHAAFERLASFGAGTSIQRRSAWAAGSTWCNLPGLND